MTAYYTRSEGDCGILRGRLLGNDPRSMPTIHPLRSPLTLLWPLLMALPAAVRSQVPVDSAGKPVVDTPVVLPTIDAPRLARIKAALADTPVAFPQLILPYYVESTRLRELDGGTGSIPMMLRSVSSIISRDTALRRRLGVFAPEVQLVRNSALPWSNNDGDLWAGRGSNIHVAGGFFFKLGALQVVVAPEVTLQPNRFFQLHIPEVERFPIPTDRSQWAFPWYVNGPFSIDMPTRFGPHPIRGLSFGQSSIVVRGLGMEAGLATENEWWGPGIGNALVLSNNAPGFPHYFLRPARPVSTRIGDIDFRWLVGGLQESPYFDTTSTNDLRSISAVAATLRTKFDRGLTFGVARSTYATTKNWKQAAANVFDAFVGTGRPDSRPLHDSTLYPGGRDQLFSLFARWVLPESGLEVYGEWGRTELPTSLRDFLTAPNHTQAYTLGLQWRRSVITASNFFRVHAENTSVEQSATFRSRPLGVWYTSRTVIQGYTNRGQPLGAAVGPGSSGQNLAMDFGGPTWLIGLKAGRIRYNEDVRSISPIFDFKRWCTHDIALYWGPRATKQFRFGFAAVDYMLGNRIQPWFQVRSGCPRGNAMVDIRNNTLTLSLVPFGRF